MSRDIALGIAAAVLFLAPAPVWAWGNLGHRLVAQVAEKHLTDKTRDAVQGLLDREEDMADASTYADEHKREITGSAPWHYVNVPIDAESYKEEFCGERGCVVGKIKEFVAILKDPTKSSEDRQMALRFVIHLVGDIHQPLHVGDNHDRGGNDLQVRFFGRGTNLHKVWDVDMLQRVSHDEDTWLEILGALDTPENQAKYMQGSVEDWANESLTAAKTAYEAPGANRRIRRGERLGQDYLDANLPVAKLRLYQAGVRLAWVLNQTFDPQ